MKKFAILAALVCLFAVTVNAAEVSRVENGKTPKGKAITYNLKEELRIGPEDGDDYFLWVGIGILATANDAGHMFVMDQREKRIVELNPEGEFIRAIGGPGEGPGEFIALNNFEILRDNSAVAVSVGGPITHFTMFDQEMAYVDRKTKQGMDFMIQAASFSPTGDQIIASGINFKMGSPTMDMLFAVIDSELNVKNQFFQAENPSFDPARVQDPEFWVEFLSKSFASGGKGLAGFAAFHSDGGYYTAVGKDYEVTRWSADHKPMKKFSKTYDRIPYTEEEIDKLVEPVLSALRDNLPGPLQQIISENVVRRAVKAAEFPPAKPPINGIKVTDQGHVWVIHDNNLAKETATVDIFDENGTLVGNFKHRSFGTMKMVFRNNKIYTIETDELGDNFLVRYSYTVGDPIIDN